MLGFHQSIQECSGGGPVSSRGIGRYLKLTALTPGDSGVRL